MTVIDWNELQCSLLSSAEDTVDHCVIRFTSMVSEDKGLILSSAGPGERFPSDISPINMSYSV